jgi:hypothetical protein
VSSLGDCLRLAASQLDERKGIIVLTYEHSPPRIDLSVLIDSFELLAEGILGVQLGPRCSGKLIDLVHPVHQQGTVFGWELLDAGRDHRAAFERALAKVPDVSPAPEDAL